MRPMKELLMEYDKATGGQYLTVDIHKLRASDIFGVAYDDVTAEQRAKGKAVNFGDPEYGYGFEMARHVDVSQNIPERAVARI